MPGSAQAALMCSGRSKPGNIWIHSGNEFYLISGRFTSGLWAAEERKSSVSSSSTFFICPLASWIRLPRVKWAGWESAGLRRYLPPTPNLGPLSAVSPSTQEAGVSLELRVQCFSFSCFGCTLFRPGGGSWVRPALSWS